MGTLCRSLVGKVKSSTPAGKAMKNILIKGGHVQNKNKAPEVNQFKMVGHEIREEKYMSGKQRRNKKNKVPNGIWRWVCLPSAEADALLFLEKKRGVESLASPRGLPSIEPPLRTSQRHTSRKQIFLHQYISLRHKYHACYSDRSSFGYLLQRWKTFGLS